MTAAYKTDVDIDASDKLRPQPSVVFISFTHTPVQPWANVVIWSCIAETDPAFIVIENVTTDLRMQRLSCKMYVRLCDYYI